MLIFLATMSKCPSDAMLRAMLHWIKQFLLQSRVAFYPLFLFLNRQLFAQEGSSLPRICIFSGLSGEEMMMFIDAFPETGMLPRRYNYSHLLWCQTAYTPEKPLFI